MGRRADIVASIRANPVALAPALGFDKLTELQIISLAGDFDISDAEEFNPDAE